MKVELDQGFLAQLALFERGNPEERAIAAEIREKMALLRQAAETAQTPEEMEANARRLGIELEEEP